MSIQINSSFRSTDIGKSPVSTFKRNSDGLEFPVMPRETDSPLMKRLIGGLTMHPHFGHPRSRGEVHSLEVICTRFPSADIPELIVILKTANSHFVNSILDCSGDASNSVVYLLREQHQLEIINLVACSSDLAMNGILTKRGQDALVISKTEDEDVYYVGILEMTNSDHLMFGAGVMIDSSRIIY